MRKAVNDTKRDTKPTILLRVISFLCNFVYGPTEEKLGDDYFYAIDYVYHCINVTPQGPANEILRIVVLHPRWALQTAPKAFSPDFTDFD